MNRFLCFMLVVFSTVFVSAGVVQVHDDQLWIDGKAQPQLFGAEVQYFRLRGGTGRNIPRTQVIALWNAALDRVVEAGMNAVSFYIPWDFHEYKEGKFDFTGTVDEDGDGQPDYPSRDVITFIRLIHEHGIQHILVRPGPYINAEWGFLGFGAVPSWFHEKFPDSHARNPQGQRTTLYSYYDAHFLQYSERWFHAVYNQVLKNNIGPGQPISFLQVDNETNFQWQSIYNHDYGDNAIQAYRHFLQDRYFSLEKLNQQHHRHWARWNEVEPASQPGQNLAEDQDWYRFQDESLFVYLKKIRAMWERIGVHEPNVLFTLAESFNATDNGLLPNYKYRNSSETGLMTVNLYPKTYDNDLHPLLNLPFKADHDVKAAEAASQNKFGKREGWTMGPEIQGGWWQGTDVSQAARQQTYLTTIGHGLKALFVYYFNEGDNWQPHYLKEAITPFYTKLKSDPQFQNIGDSDLPDTFWSQLDQIVANEYMVIDTRWIWNNGGPQPETLYFDAPLDGNAQARPPFELLKQIGTTIVKPYGHFLGSAHELEDPVCLVQDTEANVPTALSGIDSLKVQSDWAGGILGLLMQAGVNARIHHWGLNSDSDLIEKCKLVIVQDSGFEPKRLVSALNEIVDRGGSVLTFLSSQMADDIKASHQSRCLDIPSSPMEVLGYQCAIGKGRLYFAKVPIYDVFNTDFYFQVVDAVPRRQFIEGILRDANITPHIVLNGGGDRTVTFARTNPDETSLWVSIKTGRHDGYSGKVRWTNADENKSYSVTEVLGQASISISGAELKNNGFTVDLSDSGSLAFLIQPN